MKKTVVVKNKIYEIVEINREMHDFIEYVVTYKGKKYIAKKYELTSQMLDDIKSRKNIKKCGIYVPKYKKVDKKRNVTLEEYFDCEDVLQELIHGELPETYYKELFNIYRFCRFSKIEINYMPENFMMVGKKMYYLSFDYGPQKKERNLENYGLFYWIYSEEFYEHATNLGFKFNRKKLLRRPEARKQVVLMSILNW